jgi:1-aminocyclopropane-1-carboxylate deaminase/D-cysteine desulfhydrase-like pyridoxal-dependent ACC family enzyme
MLEGIARVPVGKFPTRIERAGDFWVKREDESGDLFGGNKVRKLEYVFAEARARGAKTLVTFGSLGSSHVAATASYAPRFGFEVEALLFPEPMTERVKRNREIIAASGARVRQLRSVAEVFPHRARAKARRDAFWIAGGGSSVAGAIGWVSGALEILHQVRTGEAPRPAAVYVALGSGATFAGLAWGLRGEPRIEVVGVEVVEPAWWCRWNARRLMRALDARLASRARDLGPKPTMRLVTGSRRIQDPNGIAEARERGLSLDATYTEPTLDVLLRDLRERPYSRGVLFIDSLSR